MAAGIAVAALSWYDVRRGQLWAWATAVAAPVIALGMALPAHYPNHFDTLSHLGPIPGNRCLRRRRPVRPAGSHHRARPAQVMHVR